MELHLSPRTVIRALPRAPMELKGKEVRMLAKDLMTTDLYTLEADHSLNLARFLMQARHIRHIPIVDPEFNFVGLLTHRDLLEISVSALADIDKTEQAELHRKIPIRQVMKTDVMTIDPDSKAEEVASLMLKHKYGCMPVVSKNQLIGIVTEADFLRLTIHLLGNPTAVEEDSEETAEV